jgi:hypothetical protein
MLVPASRPGFEPGGDDHRISEIDSDESDQTRERKDPELPPKKKPKGIAICKNLSAAGFS